MKTSVHYIIHCSQGVYTSLLVYYVLLDFHYREQQLLEQLVSEADGYVQPILRMVCCVM